MAKVAKKPETGTEVSNKPLRTFRLLRGRHVSRKDSLGKDIIHEWNDPKTNVIKTPIDLTQFNSSNSIKFEELHGTDAVEANYRASTAVKNSIDVMSERELIDLAQAEGINVSNASNLEELRKIIRQAG